MQIAELDGAQVSEKLFVRFDVRPVKNDTVSAKEGRPIFEDREYIEIMVPGDRGNTVHREVRDEDKQRFAPAYRAWKADAASGGLVGTPLEHWPLIAKSEVEELKYFKCHTVEQLAGMSDGNLNNVGPLTELRRKAQAFVQAAKEAAPVAKLTAELEQRDQKIAALQQQLDDIVKRLPKPEESAMELEALGKKRGK
jgi:hypothetical protein